MTGRYAHDDLDLSATASPRLPRGVRLALTLVGLLLSLVSLPLGFGFAIFSGGGHGSPFDGGAAEFAFGLTFLAVPLLILMLGIACLVCTNRVRLRIVAALGAAVPLTFGLAVFFGWWASQPHDHPELVTPAPPLKSDEVIVQGGGKHVSISCNAVSGECVQREQWLGGRLTGNGVQSHERSFDDPRVSAERQEQP
jgi:hypothetical protein